MNRAKLGKTILCLSALQPAIALAEGKMPCEHVSTQIERDLSYHNKRQTPDFLKCISKFRVCAVADNQLVVANSIKGIKSKHEATTLVIVQSARGDKSPQCLIGAYSGGSSAVWSFKAYKIIDEKAVAYKGMEKAHARGDAVSPKTAAETTYTMFKRYANKQP